MMSSLLNKRVKNPKILDFLCTLIKKCSTINCKGVRASGTETLF